MIKAILFDLDDTLYDRNQYILGSYYFACKKLGLSEDVSNYMCSEYLKNGEDNIFQKTASYYNLPDDYISQMIYYYHNSDVKIDLYPDFVEFLSVVRNDLKIGIITNGGSETQGNKIRLLNLKEMVDDIIISGEFFDRTNWKPNKKIFSFAADRLELLPAECVYVGDRLDIDVCGAVNVGMVPVLIDRNSVTDIAEKKYKDERFFEVNSLLHLEKVLNILNGENKNVK